MNAEQTFRAKAPGIMTKLMADFPIELEAAAAIVGNLGHECAGFTKLQEIKPVVKGSRGGYGWAQWTGPRRRAYEAYCARNNLDPASDKANYGFLFVELKGPEKKAIPAVQAAHGLAAKVKAFELAYERAGAKHYASREQWARIALDAFAKAGPAASQPARPAEPAPQPAPTPRPAQPSIPVPGREVPDMEPADRKAGMALIAFLAAAALALLAALFGGEAFGHEAKAGWSYPFSCCSGYDCREVAAAAISERPEGYVIARTGELVGHADTRLRFSPDGEYHWCSVAGEDDGHTICLFVPPRSY